MNEEIKEILDKIQNVVEHKEASYNGLIETKAEDYKALLNYINNLQKENDDLKNRLENAVADCNLRIQENQKLVNVINELEKCINEFPAISYASIEKVDGKRLSGILIPKNYILNKLTELKGGSDDVKN